MAEGRFGRHLKEKTIPGGGRVKGSGEGDACGSVPQ